MLLLLLSCHSDFNYDNELKVKANTTEENPVQPQAAPSPDGVYESLIWRVSGFNVQPKADYFVKSGNDIFIHTHSGRTVMNWGHKESVEYLWYENIDGKGWHEIQNDSENLLVKTDKNMANHDRYYQVRVTYDAKIVYYSKMAHVHVCREDIKATELKIKAANNYLYSLDDIKAFDRSTNISATINPENSTSKVMWTLGKFTGEKTIPVHENNLATIDSKGLLTAKNNVQGTVQVTGYIINDDGTVLSDSIEVEIGRAVEDKVGVQGKTQTFEFKAGNLNFGNDSEIEAKWLFKKKGVEKEVELSGNKDNPFALTTKTLKNENNGDQYAFILRKKNVSGHFVIFQTRYAMLKIDPPENNNVILTSNIRNLSTNGSNSTSLNNITNGDKIQYEFKIQNNGNISAKKLRLITNFRSKATILSIIIDNTEIDETNLEKLGDEENIILTIKLEDMPPDSEHTVYFITKESGIEYDEHYCFYPELRGTNGKTGLKFSNHSDNPLILDYIPTQNQISSEIKPINFEPIFGNERNTFKNRTAETNAPNSVVSIQDYRRNKDQVRVSVKQLSNFINENGDVLDAQLAFFNPDPEMIPLNKKVTVAQTKTGEELQSIQWDREHGLKLHLGNSLAKSGKYQASLEWNIENSIS